MKLNKSYIVPMIIVLVIPTIIALSDYCPPLNNGELEIWVDNCPANTVITYELHNVGGAAWDGNYQLTTAYNDYSIDTTRQTYGWDWVDGLDCCDYAFCYAKYRLTIHGYSIDLDFRDNDYYGQEDGDYIDHDQVIHFDWSTGAFSCDRGDGNIWDYRYNPGNRSIDQFTVPVTVQNQVEGGIVEINESPDSSPETRYLSWQGEDYTIESPDQDYGGLEWDFTQWSDSNTDNPRDIDVGSSGYCETSYTYTAIHSKTVPYPPLFSVGVNNDHPYLTWTAQTGTYIDGYYIYRNYNQEGFVKVKTITDKNTNNWTDTEIDFDPGGNHVYYKMKTYDIFNDESDFTLVESTKGWEYEVADQFANLSQLVFSLMQNQPNPFNPTTNISYSLEGESIVKLNVYNALGKKIRTLVNDEKAMGHHSSTWDGKDDYGRPVSAGVYIYTIQANPVSNEDRKPFRASGKMLLTK